MNVKPNPNHHIYLQTLSKITPEQRPPKAIELSELTKKLFLNGIKKDFLKKRKENNVNYMERVLIYNKRNYWKNNRQAKSLY